MGEKQTIGAVSKRLGIPSKTIRYYESQGVIAAPGRTDAGYRLYTPTDIRRLRLAKRARMLGLSLPQVRALVGQAFASECGEFAEQLLRLIAGQRAAIHRRIKELEALGSELDDLERHVQGCDCDQETGQRVADCRFCSLIDEEGGA